MTKPRGKGGGPPTQTHHPKGMTLTATEKHTLSQLAAKEESAAEREREKWRRPVRLKKNKTPISKIRRWCALLCLSRKLRKLVI